MDSSFAIINKWHNKLPPQQLPLRKKNEEWRKAHLQWADSKTFFNYNPVRQSVMHKKINYDLLDGKLHMQDLEYVLNPEQIHEKFTPQTIQHYPIINAKLNLLIGEELRRIFDFRVIITNPTALTEKENEKRDLIYQRLQELVADQSQDEQQYQASIEKMSNYFTYEWQDMREIRANYLLSHYMKEYNIPLIFNQGFKDALCIGEEIYQCDIRGGEPVIERVNPLKIRVFKSGYSNRIEDAEIIIMEDYWSPSKVIDTYYDVLTKKDIEYLETAPDNIGEASINSMGERDERLGFINHHMIDDTMTTDQFYFDPFNLFSEPTESLLPFDTSGNVRVLRMYWKSRRKIKKVKSIDPQTGEENFNFYTESYVVNKELGEEEWIYYINEAWEGTKIGEEIYINMRPRVIQYNRMSNPSLCHFGIVGSIYNLNDERPFSFVDMMKPFSYLYDIIHDRLNKLIARNWGPILRLDLAKKPNNWDVDKWLYFAKHMGLAVENSFNEGNTGAATGKLAGALNNANTGVINADLGNIVQQYTNLLEYIKMEMSDVVGISKQREGEVSNRETVGGVERATLQSSHITEWLFAVHDDIKKRALECFLETAKIALRGRKEKFQHILSDNSLMITDIDGDEFAEADYGLVVDNSNGSQELNQKLDTLGQAALQNQAISFSTLMKLYSSASLAEKQRMMEDEERKLQERQQQAQQEQMEMQQQQMQMQAQQAEAQMQMQDELNARDNETRVLVAQINSQAEMAYLQIKNHDDEEPVYTEEAKAKLAESMRQFDKKIALDREKLEFEKQKAKTDAEIKRQQIKSKKVNNAK